LKSPLSGIKHKTYKGKRLIVFSLSSIPSLFSLLHSQLTLLWITIYYAASMRKRGRSPSPTDSNESDNSGIEEILPPTPPRPQRSKRPYKKKAKLASDPASFTTSLAAATSSALSRSGARGDSKTRRMLEGLIASVDKGMVSKAEAEAVKGLRRGSNSATQRKASSSGSSSTTATASQKGKARARPVSEPKAAVTTVGTVVMLPFGVQKVCF
jgi:hypothetical protein